MVEQMQSLIPQGQEIKAPFSSTKPVEETAPVPKAPQRVDPTPPVQPDIQTAPSAVVTSDPARAEIAGAEAQLAEISAELQRRLEQQNQQKESPTVPDLETTTDTAEIDPIDQLTKQTETKIDEAKRQFDKYFSKSSSLARSTIASIQQSFAERRKDAREVAENAKQASNVLGARTGRLRYAPEIQRGIISGQENALIKTIAELDAMEIAAIAGAEAAQFERDYETFLEQMEEVNRIRTEQEEKFTELESAIKAENEKREAEKERMKYETTIIEQFANGVTDPVEVFQNLQGEVPYDLIVEYTSTLPEEMSTEPVKLGRYDRLVDPVTGEVIAGQALGGGVSGGVGSGGGVLSVPSADGGRLSFRLNEVPTDSNLAVAQIGPAIYGTRISDGESARVKDIVEKGMAAGQTLGEIMMITAQFDPSKNKDLGQGLITALQVGADPEDGLQGMGLGNLARLLEADNQAGAVQWVENSVMAKARERDPSMEISEGGARIFARQADDFFDMLNDMPEGLSGAAEGTVDEWLGRFRSSEQSKIKQRVTEMSAKLRNDMLGSAVTPAEERFLEALIPKLSDQPSVFIDKVNRLADTPLVKLNEYRSLNGLPTINRDQLLNTAQRVSLYTTGAQTATSTQSNFSLLLGGEGIKSDYSGVPSVLDNL